MSKKGNVSAKQSKKSKGDKHESFRKRSKEKFSFFVSFNYEHFDNF